MFGNQITNTIEILDLHTNEMRKSNINCPTFNKWRATIRSDECKELLIMNGYIREITNDLNISYPPNT